ncbi:MAG: copper homeostasis membrane protein CopD [Herpetosiphon sp.]
MSEVGLIVSRLLHYAATLTLFGVSIFPLYIYAKRQTASHLNWATTWWLAAAAFVSGLFWFASVTFNMAGKLDLDALWLVLSETSFGKIWMIRLIFMIILVLATVKLKSPSGRLSWLFPALCAGLLVSLAGVGHTQIENGITHFIHIGADGLHLLAAGAWLGGLVSLFSLVARAVRTSSPGWDAEATNAAIRFSGMGYLAVATLIGSGLINSWFLVGSPSPLVGTPYGQVLIVKLVLFAGMLVLASVNRFLIVPKLIKANEGHRAGGLVSLRRHIVGEQALGLAIVLIVSVLGTMQPAVTS